ncbi:MAG: sulfotransferase [Anaerolineales bacterium]|nr:sulfotransferase [Anaerolineales bacterium]
MKNKFSRRLSLACKVLLSGGLPQTQPREISSITPEEVEEARRFFPLDKFFIYGHARSGTTLLARLIRLHPQVHCNYQAHFFTRSPLLESLVVSPETGEWLARRSNRWNRGKDLSPVVLRAAADFIMEREARQEGKGGTGCVVGDKSPNSLLDGESVRLTHKVYPDASLIYIIRDGRDTALSHRFQNFIEHPESLSAEDKMILDEFTRDPQPFLNGQRSVFSEKAIRQAAEGWARNVSETDQMARQYYDERYYHLRYEDLLEDTFAEMIRLWEFLGVDIHAAGLKKAVDAETRQNPDAEWQQQKASQVASPLQKGKRGSYKEFFTERDKKVFMEIAGETLRIWRYEA